MPSEPPDPNDIQAKLQEIYRRQAELYDSLTAALEKELDRIITQVLAALMEQLRGSLKLDDGTVARTPENLVVLTKLDSQFQKLVTKYGYRRAITAFVSKFPQQFELLSDTFQVLSSVLNRKWLKQGNLFRPADLKVLSAQQLVAKDELNDLAAQTGRRAKTKALQLVGSGSFAEMQTFLHTAFDRGTADAKTLGTTAMATFWRVASAQVYERIQEGQETPLRFTLFGPLDERNRVWCRKMETLSRKGVTWTAEEISQMSNGITPVGSCMELAGGPNCRHSFSIAVDESRGST
jgi:hypothetical protein